MNTTKSQKVLETLLRQRRTTGGFSQASDMIRIVQRDFFEIEKKQRIDRQKDSIKVKKRMRKKQRTDCQRVLR